MPRLLPSVRPTLWPEAAASKQSAAAPPIAPTSLAPAESDAVAAVLGAEAAAADWARKPTAPADGFAALGGRPTKRQRGDHEWAVK